LPVGMMLPCGAIPVRPITGRLSLFPPSHARPPSAFLAVGLPFPAKGRVCRVPRKQQERVRSRLSPGGYKSPCGWSLQPAVHPLAFWPKPVSMFGLFSITGFISDSHKLTNTAQPSPLPRHARRYALPSRVRLASFEDGVHCPASFTPSRCRGRMWR
jgi:hypothetical protein